MKYDIPNLDHILTLDPKGLKEFITSNTDKNLKVGITEGKRLFTLYENDDCIERIEFKRVNNAWEQADRKVNNKKEVVKGKELLNKKQIQMGLYSVINFFSTDKYFNNSTTFITRETKDYNITITIDKK